MLIIILVLSLNNAHVLRLLLLSFTTRKRRYRLCKLLIQKKIDLCVLIIRSSCSPVIVYIFITKLQKLNNLE